MEKGTRRQDMDNETKEKAAELAGEAKKKATGIWSKCAGKIATLWKSGVKGKVICIVGTAVILLVLRCCISGDERSDDPAKSETVEKAQPSRVDNAKTPAVPGSINFFGFYTGMLQSEATALAARYGVEVGEETFKENPETHEVYEFKFSLDDVRRISKGPDTFEKLVESVAKQLKVTKPKMDSGWNRGMGELYCITTDGVDFRLNKYNCTLFDRQRAQEAQRARKAKFDSFDITPSLDKRMAEEGLLD